MNKRIIYPNSAGGISIIIPAPCNLTIEEIARKDVPAGVPFQIIDAAIIPTDRSDRDAWEYDFSRPDGHGIGQEAWFAARKNNGGGN